MISSRCTTGRAALPRLRPRRGSRAARVRLVVARAEDEDEEMGDKVAQFLKAQDMSERGLDKRLDITEVLGADEVSEEEAKAYCRDVTRILRLLSEKRDMEVREAKLILQIDDPRLDEARKMGVEDSRGVSREEMADALELVIDGKVPTDRIALRVLHGEMVNWPFLESDATPSPPPAVEIRAPVPGEEADTEDEDQKQSPGWRPNQPRPPKGRDPGEKPQGLQDLLPEWMGYSALYAFTLIPVLILGTTIAILFFSSLK